jgi:hypothetical protein
MTPLARSQLRFLRDSLPSAGRGRDTFRGSDLFLGHPLCGAVRCGVEQELLELRLAGILCSLVKSRDYDGLGTLVLRCVALRCAVWCCGKVVKSLIC